MKYKKELDFFHKNLKRQNSSYFVKYIFEKDVILFEHWIDEIKNPVKGDGCIDYVFLKINKKYIRIKYHSIYRKQMKLVINKLKNYIARKIYEYRIRELNNGN